jgi:hypothetical protein
MYMYIYIVCIYIIHTYINSMYIHNTYIYIYIFIYLWTSMYICIYIYICVCVLLYIYVCALLYTYICVLYIYICTHVYVIHIYIYIPLYSYFLNRLCLKLYSTIWVAWWYPNHGFARQTIGWRTLERSPGNQKAHGYDIVMTHLGSQKSDSLVFRIKTVLELSTFLRCFGR